jgi:hypothetical protein
MSDYAASPRRLKGRPFSLNYKTQRTSRTFDAYDQTDQGIHFLTHSLGRRDDRSHDRDGQIAAPDREI